MRTSVDPPLAVLRQGSRLFHKRRFLFLLLISVKIVLSSSFSRLWRQYDISSFTIENEVPKKRKNKKQNGSNKRRQGEKNDPKGLYFAVLKKPDLRTQLEYARNGHAVMRSFLPADELLQRLRKPLKDYCESQQLVAWRQKVEVAADTEHSEASKCAASRLAASCETIQDCQVELHRLLQLEDDDISLPFLQYFNTWRKFEIVLHLANALAESAAILMDVDSVRLYQDAVFWKRSSDGPTPWHADARMAPFDTSHMITFWIPLEQKVTDTGLVFCSKTHADFALPYWNENVAAVNLEERYVDSNVVDYMPLSAGDVTVHHGWTLHCANGGGGGGANDERIALAISFVDASATIRKKQDEKGDREDAWSYQDWVKDVPSDTRNFVHPLVPILWSRKK